MGLELSKADIITQPLPEARVGTEMSYEPPFLLPLPVQLWFFLESGSHESHISCVLEGDSVPRQLGG